MSKSFTENRHKEALTVDMVVFMRQGDDYSVLLIKRKNPPYKGYWALPGGYIESNERVIDAAYRELKEETSLQGVELEFFQYFDAPRRDPRNRAVSFGFVGIMEEGAEEATACDDAKELQWHRLGFTPHKLAFDHSEILDVAVSEMKLTGRFDL